MKLLTLPRRLRRFLFAESGTAMVELALVAGGIVIPLVFGVIELGRSVYAKTTITAAAREGVRYAIVHGSQSGAVADSAAIADYVQGRTVLSPIVVRPSWSPNKDYGSVATVTVTYNYVPLVPVIRPRTLRSTSKQVIAF